MTQKQIKKIPEPYFEYISNCNQCQSYYSESIQDKGKCIKVNRIDFDSNPIPTWCPLKDYNGKETS